MQFGHLKRRDLITLLGGAAATSSVFRLQTARAQQANKETTTPTTGFLGPSSAAGLASYVDGFRQGLAATGFVEGRTVAVDYRWADNQLDRLPVLAAELVARRVAVIATGSATAAVLAAKTATSTIPIVFAIGADPVKFGLVASMNRPGGNITGISFLGNALVAKQLQLTAGVVAGLRRDRCPGQSGQPQRRVRQRDGAVRGVVAAGENPRGAYCLRA
jgi:ABC-type uncharacterized transport system substrate-binding protein